jgi:hypothetical protein
MSHVKRPVDRLALVDRCHCAMDLFIRGNKTDSPLKKAALAPHYPRAMIPTLLLNLACPELHERTSEPKHQPLIAHLPFKGCRRGCNGDGGALASAGQNLITISITLY